MAVIWTISTLEHEISDGAVVVAHWRATDSEVVGEVEHSGSSYGTCGFTPDATASDYVAYDSLTEEVVIGWVKDSVDAEAVEAGIAEQIEASKAPVTAAGVPW